MVMRTLHKVRKADWQSLHYTVNVEPGAK